jgi:seryl-tRNA synthetase
MLDLRSIRDDPDRLDRSLGRRGAAPLSAQILDLDAQRRAVQTGLQDMQTRRNTASKAIGQAMGQGKADEAEALKAEVAALKDTMAEAEANEKALAAELEAILAGTPNILDEDVPEGPDESGNVELRRHGEPATFDFEPREHFDLGEALGMMDFDAAAKLSGSRFTVLRGPLARLERALAQFMLDTQTEEFGYTETSVPILVRDEALFGTGQLPKFAEDLFRTTAGHWLIPTAEVPLTNLVAGDILDEAALPIRVIAHTPCFRAEAGAAGRDTRGMLRQHQFYKVELVSIAHPDHSDEEHERMTGCAEAILARLGLAYRTMVLCSGDTGFGAAKTYDIEVWLPGQGQYREISSCSNTRDFQARRMNARFRPAEGKGTRFVHTLNGSGLAVGRTLIAVMETYQQADGSVVVPKVLRRYMGGREVIARDA